MHLHDSCCSGRVDVGEVVELRVHGVSGTPPQELLDCPLVTQLAGDAKAGFYKPRLYEEERDPRRIDGQPATTGPRLEGYAWGGLTSGAPMRAFWLLLLPFTLTNVAPRLRPEGKWKVLVPALWFASRLMALAMTMLIVAAACGVTLDLFAWQCGTSWWSTPNCSNASPGWLLQPILGMSIEHRLAVGAVVPLLLLVLLWQLSGRTINNYEGISTGIATPDSHGANEVEPNLDSLWMWNNEQLVRRLRHLHLQAGFATVLWLVSYPFPSAGWHAVRIIGAVALAAYIAVMLLIPAYTGREEHPGFKKLNIAVWIVVSAFAVSVAVELVWGHPLPARGSLRGLPGYAGSAQAIFFGLLACFLGFAALVLVMSLATNFKGRSEGPAALGDLAAIVLATLGVFLGAVFSSGIYVFAAGWLTTGSVKPGFADVSKASVAFDMPNVVRDATRAYAVSVAALVVSLVVLVLVVLVKRLWRSLRGQHWPAQYYLDALAVTYPDVPILDQAATAQRTGAPMPDRAGPPEARRAAVEVRARAGVVGRTLWIARQVDFAHRYLAVLMVLGVVITAFFARLVLVSDANSRDCLVRWHEYLGPGHGQQTCSHASTGIGQWVWEGFLSARSLQGTGAYLIVLSILLLVAVGIAAFRSTSKRKSIGILWDLASFWPRAAHPFAAPCYAERAVPDLVTRIHWYTSARDDGPCPVVLAAHSQGTVISAATILQLEAIDRSATERGDAAMIPSVAYLSFGCVLRRLYARYFPAYFSSLALGRVRSVLTPGPDAAPRWINLWRYSDYLGGTVMSGPPPDRAQAQAIDVQSIDPLWRRAGGATTWPVAYMHSYYWADAIFPGSVRTLAENFPHLDLTLSIDGET
jgi:hypothetical protein